MHPAYSIIVFTTASGAGYGLVALLGAYAVAGPLPADRGFALASLGLALVLVTAGLLASTFHLGHPERAWRALSQWRSSWLSREGVCALATYVPAALFALGWAGLPAATAGAWRWLGGVAGLLALLTVLCTAMIYASLAAVPRWRNPWVPAGYLALALMTGALWLNALAAGFGVRLPGLVGVSAGLVVAAGAVKIGYWRSIRRAAPASTLATATGLGASAAEPGRPARISALAAPHGERAYLLDEMGYRLARKHAERLREHAALLGFALPLVLLLLGWSLAGPPAIAAHLAAAAVASAGTVVERWLFFAEAEHKVVLYYGRAEAV